MRIIGHNLFNRKDTREILVFFLFVLIAFMLWCLQQERNGTGSSRQQSPSQAVASPQQREPLLSDMTFEVPVQGVGFPVGYRLKTFPPKVKVTFQVDMTQYNTVDATDFAVTIDYRSLSSSQMAATPSVSSFPSHVKNIRLNPETVEYLIEQTSNTLHD